MKELSPEEVKKQLETNQAILIDVREEIEYVEEHIAGSVLYSLSSLKTKEFIEKYNNQNIIVHCRSGKRSQQAINKLIEAGFNSENLSNLQGGIEFWKSSGLEVTKPKGKQPLSIMRQVQIVVGFCVFTSVLLSVVLNNQYYLILAGVFGAGLLFAGLTGTCGLAICLAQLPFNKNLICKSCNS